VVFNQYPIINSYNSEMIGMGESPYAGDLLHLSLKFLSEYTDNKADEIEAMILDPHYSLSHHVVLKETGEDTRIFATEIPEVNQDDDPDNDVAYDSFEVKINYPLPYPQIIEKGQIRNSIDGLTHRSLADSCEIEYVKKNGEIINDLDDDGEIQEKERLHFPVWQGPDYEENDIKPYLISNMFCNENAVAKLDQKQFVPENTKFKIKVLSASRRNIINIIISVGNEEIVIPCNYENGNIYYSDRYVMSDNINEDEYIIMEQEIYKFLKIDINSDKIMKIRYNDLEREIKKSKNFLYIYSYPTFWFSQFIVKQMENLMIDLGYMFNKNLNPEKNQVIEQLNEKPDVFYYFGHTQQITYGNTASNMIETISGLTLKSGIFGGGISDIEDIFLLKKNEIPLGSNMKFVFINGCWSAKLQNNNNRINYDTGEEYRKVFNTDFYIGWNDKPNSGDSINVSKILFAYLNSGYTIKRAYFELIKGNSDLIGKLRLIQKTNAKDIKLKINEN